MTFTGSLIAIAWKLIDQKFKCTARLADWICHTKFHCRLHYDRHIEIDHVNVKALDKYNLAKIYEKHSKNKVYDGLRSIMNPITFILSLHVQLSKFLDNLSARCAPPSLCFTVRFKILNFKPVNSTIKILIRIKS